MEGSPEGVIVGAWAHAGADASQKAQTRSNQRGRMQGLWGGGRIRQNRRVQEEGQRGTHLVEAGTDYSVERLPPFVVSARRIRATDSSEFSPCSRWRPPRWLPPASDQVRRQPGVARSAPIPAPGSSETWSDEPAERRWPRAGETWSKPAPATRDCESMGRKPRLAGWPDRSGYGVPAGKARRYRRYPRQRVRLVLPLNQIPSIASVFVRNHASAPMTRRG